MEITQTFKKQNKYYKEAYNNHSRKTLYFRFLH